MKATVASFTFSLLARHPWGLSVSTIPKTAWGDVGTWFQCLLSSRTIYLLWKKLFQHRMLVLSILPRICLNSSLFALDDVDMHETGGMPRVLVVWKVLHLFKCSFSFYLFFREGLHRVTNRDRPKFSCLGDPRKTIIFKTLKLALKTKYHLV